MAWSSLLATVFCVSLSIANADLGNDLLNIVQEIKRSAMEEKKTGFQERLQHLSQLQQYHQVLQKLAGGQHQMDEVADPDEGNADIEKLTKHTNENYQKKTDNEILISKGMEKNILNKNGETAKKTVKENQDKKPNGEEVIDKEAHLEVDRNPQPTENATTTAAPIESGGIILEAFHLFNLAFVLVISHVLTC